MGIYGNKPIGASTKSLVGVIVGTQSRGQLAHVIYSSIDQPLYKVPRRLYDPEWDEKKERKRYKEVLAVGDHVEFGADKSHVVQWMQKAPHWLNINCTGPALTLDTVATIAYDKLSGSPRLWGPECGFATASEQQLRGQRFGVPLQCHMELAINYGEFEGADQIPVNGRFRPHFSFKLIECWGKQLKPMEENEVLRHLPPSLSAIPRTAPVPMVVYARQPLETINTHQPPETTNAYQSLETTNTHQSLETVFEFAARVLAGSRRESSGRRSAARQSAVYEPQWVAEDPHLDRRMTELLKRNLGLK